MTYIASDTLAPAPDDLRHAKLGTRTKLLYAVGAVIDGVTSTSLTYFLFFYLTSVCGLSGTLAGLSTLLALVLDAIADPAIGLISDNTRSRLGRRVPYLLFTPLPLALLFVALFSVPATFTGLALFGYVTFIAMALRIMMSAYTLPYLAAGAELTDDYNDRTSIVSYRIAFQMLGTLLAISLGLGVFMAGEAGLMDRGAYIPFAWVLAGVIVVSGAISAFAVRRELPRLHVEAPVEGAAPRSIFRELGEVFRNRSFLILFSATLIFFVGQGAGGALALHFNSYFWNLSGSAVQIVIIALTLGPFVGAPLNAFLARTVEKRTLTIANLFLFAALLVWPPVLRLLDLLPHDEGTVVVILAVNGFLTGATLVGAAIGFQSMLADAADEHEYLFGVRREGLFFSGLTLAVKAASGLGILAAGIALDLIGFPTEMVAGAGAAQLSPEIVRNLGIIGGPGPALITLLSPLALFAYALTRARHAALLAELGVRRRTP